MKRLALFSIVSIFATSLVFAQPTPPSLMNYQGVLRDASDHPLNGTYDMVFRFHGASVGGDEILLDSHTAASGGQVSVSGGLFNVSLGGGAVSDGSGPGYYGTLEGVFRDYGEVWLSIQVGAETLSPRIRIVSAAYALNASNLGGKAPRDFLDTSLLAQTKVGPLTVNASGASTTGITGQGTQMGGYFKDSDSSGYANVAYGDDGILAYGTWLGGYFQDLDGTGTAYVAYGDMGIEAFGGYAAGYFVDSDSSGRAYVAFGDQGIRGEGNVAGGYFLSAYSGQAYVGYFDYGIYASGNGVGAYLRDSDQSGQAYVGYGDAGIIGYGNTYGGYFADLDNSGHAICGFADRGIDAAGNDYGGYFADLNQSGYAYVGKGDDGIYAYGNEYGGYFQNGSSVAIAAQSSDGIQARAPGNGVWGEGYTAGGLFDDYNSYGWSWVGYDTYKIYGLGSVSFVQDHPFEKDKVIVYAAPEGDEVAVYTRGTARLASGEARVPLGPTFKWVANPDIGLTAQLTPRGDCSGLYVASLSTDELVVRELNGGTSNVVFDYVVYGLRIGFEESSVVQEKVKEAYIPSMRDHRELYERRPELRPYNALERYRGMEKAAGLPAADSTRADALRAAIHEYDPATDPAPCELLGSGPCLEARTVPRAEPMTLSRAKTVARGELAPESVVVAGPISSVAAPAQLAAMRADKGVASSPALTAPLLPVGGPVEAGDLLVLDPSVPGQLKKCDAPADPAVVGIALGEATAAEGQPLQAPVAGTGFVTIKVDAQYGAIRPGDLLVSSVTAGHAMKAPDVLVAGTVIGKALEALENGTGLIKMLVMPR